MDRGIKKCFERDRFARYVGVELVEVSEGKAVARMKIQEHHLNGVGIVHGAAIFSLADLAFAGAANSHGTVAVAINVNISFLKAVSQGMLVARAEEISRNPKLGIYSIRVTNEEDELIATFEGMVYRKKDSLLLASEDSGKAS
ncbi:MAG: PaaI family thioesterase [Syntrophobacteraceae bacterium]|nr:PaaI family thioesterase [Syntrophobacteraceae bacterium]